MTVRQFALSGLVAFGIYIFGAGLTYCAQFGMAHAASPHAFGTYTYALAWVAVLAYCAVLGFDVSMLRFVAAYRAQESWSLLLGVVRYAEIRVLAFGCILALAGAVAVWLRQGYLSGDMAKTFYVGFCLVPVLALLWVRSSVVRALGGIISALAPDRIIRDGTLLGIVATASLAFGMHIDAPALMLATLVGAVVALVAVSLTQRRLMPAGTTPVAPSQDRAKWARAVPPLVAIGFADIAMNRTGVVLLGWSDQTTAAGVFAITYGIALLATLPRTAVGTLFVPTVSGLFARGDTGGLRMMATRATLWTFAGTLCAAAPPAIFAEWILAWFGPDFTAGAPALRILLLGHVVAAVAGPQLHLLTMTGRERSAAATMLVAVAIGAAAGAAAIGPFGLTGVAVTSAATGVGWNAALAVLVWRHLGLAPGAIACLPQRTGRGWWPVGVANGRNPNA